MFFCLDESGIDRKRENNMRFAEVSSSDEATNMSQFYRNGILQQMYGVDEKIASAYRATDSPLKSSPRKRSSSPTSRTETEQPAKVHMTQPLNHLVAAATPPVGQLPTGNHVIPFSTSTPQTTNDAITSQGLSRLMYSVQNPALLMAQRVPTAPGFTIPDMSMVVPPQLAAAYGQTAAGLFPQQFAALSALPDAEKRLMESITAAGLSTQTFPAHWLGNPYLKNPFPTPSSDLSSSKEANRSATKATIPPAGGLANLPHGYSADFLLKYPEALNAELLKHQDRTLASQSMTSGVSPEVVKKSAISVHHPTSAGLPLPPEVLAASNMTKSSNMDWKVPASAGRGLKHEGGQSGFEVRQTLPTNRRDAAFSENLEGQAKAEEARHKLAGLAQR